MSPYSNDAAHVAQLKRIEQSINKNQLQEAARQLNTLAKATPDDPRLFLLGSRLAEAAHNPAGMLQAARKAHQLAPGWPVATIHLAEVLAGKGDAVQALAMARLAIQQGKTLPPLDPELLVKAATVAHRLNQYQPAVQWLREAEQISPDNTSIRYKLAISLAHSGEPDPALEIFTALLALQPGNPGLLSQRMRTAISAGQNDLAIQDGEALLALEPHNAVHQFYLDIARGNTPKTQPVEVVTELFDAFAPHFDQNVVAQLHYQLPSDVAQKIIGWYPDFKVDVLDLGCGTGLLGASLGPIDGALIGVDLSQQMIDQAAAHNVYHRFHRVNVLDALADTPSDHYDVITALDVLIYVGELDTVIPNALRILTRGGRFVFSCETGADDGADYALQGTLRYTHQRAYVQRLLEQAGFEDIEANDLVLRQEAGEPVRGFLVTARKPLKAAGKTVRRSPKSAKPAPAAQ
jgi:predicted TPR repeat methyltransferase